MRTVIRDNIAIVPLLSMRIDPQAMAMTADSVVDIPFNELLQIESCDEPAGLLRLAPRPCLANHVGTLHAGALMTLAEAASAKFLMLRLGMRQDVVPLLRRFEAKFCRPATSTVTATARAEPDTLARFKSDVETKGWGLITVNVELHDESDAKVLSAQVCWYVKRLDNAE